MRHSLTAFIISAIVFFSGVLCLQAEEDGRVVRKALTASIVSPNLLKDKPWAPWEKGFDMEGNIFSCNNGSDSTAQRGVSRYVELNQTEPQPIVAVAWSKAEGVGGGPDSDYSLYLDLIYSDGTPLWGQIAAFDTGTHDWQRREVKVIPEKPVKSVSFYMLLRRHSGRAFFRDPELSVMALPNGAGWYDSIPVAVESTSTGEAGFLVRDAAAGSDFVNIQRQALGLQLEIKTEKKGDASIFDAVLSDHSGKDRAITLLYRVPWRAQEAVWLEDARHTVPVQIPRQYINGSNFNAGVSGKLSKYPFGAVMTGGKGEGLGIDMASPAFFRVGYSSAVGELFLAYDLALTREKPSAHVRFCCFEFDPKWNFRSALACYYDIFPDAFKCRTPEQGVWLPYGKISAIQDWADFGFKFKEGNEETAWEDRQGILTFRYTEPMTWWMPMPLETPRTMENALAVARRLADNGDKNAKALFTSGYHDKEGRFVARLLNEPWCNGAVWSMNSMSGVAGDVTDFKNKWGPDIRAPLYGPERKGDLDGEYVDSSEGYVTDELNYRRDHFSATETPLTFSREDFKPAIFRGLNVFEYVRAIAKDVRDMNKLMMANSTPGRLCWLAPMLDVMGTETNWFEGGRWQPMSDADLLYRRSLCKGKPFCFLMNTDFDKFPRECVEKFMERCLAYGIFPGFFSYNAMEKAYFITPNLYNRDRPLFRKYLPLCRKVAEAGWEPITLAKSGDERIYVERFGENLLTVFNDSDSNRTAVIVLDGLKAASCRDLVTGKDLTVSGGMIRVSLAAEDVAVLEMNH